MPLENDEQRTLLPLARKRLGFSQYYGKAHFGYSFYGQENPYAGIYQRRRNTVDYVKGYGSGYYGSLMYGNGRTYNSLYGSKKKVSKLQHGVLSFYWPTNPRTPTQQAWRNVFTMAALAWQGLTSDQKAEYNNRAKLKHMTGYHLHQREYLLSH